MNSAAAALTVVTEPEGTPTISLPAAPLPAQL